jgi:hypothetical protein
MDFKCCIGHETGRFCNIQLNTFQNIYYNVPHSRPHKAIPTETYTCITMPMLFLVTPNTQDIYSYMLRQHILASFKLFLRNLLQSNFIFGTQNFTHSIFFKYL